jgi:hypothetical protein
LSSSCKLSEKLLDCKVTTYEELFEPFEALIGLGSMIVGKGSKLLCDFGIRTDERSCYLLPTETLNSKELFLCVTGLLNSIERS